MKAVSAADMRAMDKRTIEEAGITGDHLMRMAGALFASALMEFISSLMKSEVFVRNIIILAGKGNNAGDAFFAARMLSGTGDYNVFLHCMCREEELSGDALGMFRELPDKIKGRIKYGLDPADLALPDSLVVDALLGTGFHGPLRGDYAKWIRIVNGSRLPVVALDIPSGMDPDTGLSSETAVRADLTVTIALPKKGMLTPDGVRLCGRIRVVNIGIPSSFADSVSGSVECTDRSDAAALFDREAFDTYKNRRGHLLVLGGSSLYCGAPLLAAEAALRAGVGLVSAAIPAKADVFAQVPKAVMIRRIADDGKGFFCEASWKEAEDLTGKADAVVVGPGIGHAHKEFLGNVLKYPGIVLADADALNLLAENPELLLNRKAILVMTPHEGEMTRLERALDLDGKAERMDRAKALAVKTKAFVVLKGPRTVVASPEGLCAVNLSGTPALATAGSGDVLSGIAGALLARSVCEGFSVFDALRAAVFIHGYAAELAAPVGSRGFIADDFLYFIQSAMRKISPTA